MDQTTNSEESSQLREPQLTETQLTELNKVNATLDPLVQNCRSFLTSVMETLDRTQPKITRRTILLAAMVLFVANAFSYLLYQNDTPAPQIIAASLGEVFVLALIGVAALVDLKNTSPTSLKDIVRAELGQVDELDRDLRKMAKTQAVWRNELALLRSKLNRNRQAITEQGQQIASLHQQRLNTESVLLELTQQTDVARDAFEAIEISIEKETSKLNQIHQECSEADRQLVIQREQIKQAELQTQTENAKLETLLSEQHDQESKVSLQESNLTKMTEQLAEAELNLAKSQTERMNLEAHIELLTDEIDTLEQFHKTLQQQNDEASVALESATGRASELQHNIETLSEEKGTLAIEIEELTHQRNDATEQRQSIVEQLEIATNQFNQMVVEKDAIATEVNVLQLLSRELSETNQATTRSNEHLFRTNTLLRKKVTRVRERLNRFHQTRMSEIADLERCIAEKQSELQRHTAEAEASRHRLTEWEQAITNANDDFNAANEAINEIQTTTAELNAQRDDLVASCEALKNDLSHLRANQHAERERYLVTKNEADSLEARLEQLNQDQMTQSSATDKLKLKEVALVQEVATLTKQRHEQIAAIDRATAQRDELLLQSTKLREDLVERDRVRWQLVKLNEEKTELENHLETLTLQTRQSEQVLQDLEATAVEFPIRLTELETEIVARGEDRQHLEIEIDGKQAELKRLTFEVDQLRERERELSETNQSLSDTSDRLNESIVSHQTNITELTAERERAIETLHKNEELQATLADLAHSIEQSNQELNSVQQAIAAAQSRLQKAETEMNTNEDKLNTANEKLEACRHETELAMQEKTITIKAVDDLTETAQKLRLEIEDMQSTLIDLHSAKDELIILQKDRDALKDGIASAELEIKRLQRQSRQLSSQCHESEKQLATVEAQTSELQRQQHDHQEATHRCVEEVKQLAGQKQSVLNELDLIEAAVAKRQTAMDELDQDLQNKLREQSQLNLSIDELKSEEGLLQQHAGEIEILQAELDSLRTQENELRASLETISNQVQDSNTRRSEVKVEIQGLGAELKAMREEAEHSAKISADLAFEVNEKQRRLDELSQEQSAAQQRLDLLNDEASHREAELARQRENERLEWEKSQSVLTQLLSELAATEESVNLAKADLEKREEEVIEAHRVSQQWDAYLLAIQTECSSYDDQKRDFEMEMEATTSERDRVAKELDQHVMDCANARQQLEDAGKDLSELKNQTSELTLQHDEMNEQFESLTTSTLALEKNLEKQNRLIEEASSELERLHDFQKTAKRDFETNEVMVAELVDKADQLREEIADAQAHKQDLQQEIQQKSLEHDRIARRLETVRATTSPKSNEPKRDYAATQATTLGVINTVETIADELRAIDTVESPIEIKTPTIPVLSTEIAPPKATSGPKAADPWSRVFD